MAAYRPIPAVLRDEHGKAAPLQLVEVAAEEGEVHPEAAVQVPLEGREVLVRNAAEPLKRVPVPVPVRVRGPVEGHDPRRVLRGGRAHGHRPRLRPANDVGAEESIGRPRVYPPPSSPGAGEVVPTVTQLRIYRIKRGKMNAWVREWNDGVRLLRQRFGYTIEGAWVVPGENTFVWIVSYNGVQPWEAKEAEYYGSAERANLQPDPARLIERQETMFLAPALSE
ncbi:MAG: hypothetical protein E6K18_05365 [Methanobacteriota archaeon]|nr:MAG: hypothetical protein E6K18_05365 [Euryarchaeota archaeon]